MCCDTFLALAEPPPLPAALPPRSPCPLGSCLAWPEGQDAPEREFHGVRWMMDSSSAGERERGGGTAQNPRSGSPGWEGGEGGRLARTEEQNDFPLSLLNSKTWNTKSTVDLYFYRSLWSRLWNKSSCGALGGMLYTEFNNKVSPYSPPVLVRCWKCGYLHAGAKCQTDKHQGAYLTYFHCILNLGPFLYYLYPFLVSQRILLIAILFFFSFL